MYKFEIHLHSSACSACAISSAEEMIDAAVLHNYSGVVFTNHFFHGNTAINRKLSWTEFVKAYADDYYRAKKYGDKHGITVLFGLEEVYEPGKEMLIYGLSPEIIANNPQFNSMNGKEKSKFIHKNNGIVVCAHPFRDRAYIPNPNKTPDISIFDAIECFNYFNKKPENQKAFDFCIKNSIMTTSGGDIHNKDDFGNAGLDFLVEIKNNKQFVEAFKNHNYKLIL